MIGARFPVDKYNVTDKKKSRIVVTLIWYVLPKNENEILDFKDPGVRGLQKKINSQRKYIVKTRMNYSEKFDLTRSEREGRSRNDSWVFKNQLGLVTRNQQKKCIVLCKLCRLFFFKKLK